jgi:hypothetical protein
MDLTVMHPELFSAFVDIAGDVSPNTGTKDETIARLFSGNADAWAYLRPDHGDHAPRPRPRPVGLVRRRRHGRRSDAADSCVG